MGKEHIGPSERNEGHVSAKSNVESVDPIELLHQQACLRGEHGYIDPTHGRWVFSRVGLLAQGDCCGSGCRHCPYGHRAVPRNR